jgi:hypothetical protein
MDQWDRMLRAEVPDHLFDRLKPSLVDNKHFGRQDAALEESFETTRQFHRAIKCGDCNSNVRYFFHKGSYQERLVCLPAFVFSSD